MKPSQFDARLGDLEDEITRLRAIYEQWFQGIERVPPIRMRERLDRKVRRLRREAPNNTALRFKYQTIFQRWVTFTQYWDRITRRIEEGTYHRDVKKVRRRRAAMERRQQSEDEGPKSVEVELDMDMDVDAEIDAALAALGGASSSAPPAQPTALSLPDMDLDEHPARPSRPVGASKERTPAPPTPAAKGPPRPAPPAPPTPAAKGPSRPAPPAPPAPGARSRPAPPAPGTKGRPAPPPPPGAKGRPAPGTRRGPPPPPPNRSRRTEERLRDDDMRRIFDKYVEARKRVGKRPDGVSYEKLAGQIRKMEPQLRKKHAGKKIDFEVVVKDGRVGLKPVARRKSGDD